jgi:glycosyltransferase involved in cell wall biosynthesis
LKIAIVVNPQIPVPPEKYGGIERIVFMLIQYLKKKGHDVTLYANKYSHPGCKLVAYDESLHYGFKDMIRINLLTARISRSGYDIVHTFGRMSNIALLMLSDIPKIVSYQLPPTKTQVKKAVKIALGKTLRFTACSDYIAGQIKDIANVTTIYNGVDPDDYGFNRFVGSDAPLTFLGRIQYEKGTALAVHAALATNQKLVIAGNVPNEAIHQQYFREEIEPYIDGDQIKYVGPVNDKQKEKLLQNSKAFLMPVQWDEPFGIVMTEALACGTPVIGLRRGSVPEIITDGLNGFVCDTESDFFAAIHHIGELDRTACRKVLERRFSANVLGAQYEALYHQAISEK